MNRRDLLEQLLYDVRRFVELAPLPYTPTARERLDAMRGTLAAIDAVHHDTVQSRTRACDFCAAPIFFARKGPLWVPFEAEPVSAIELPASFRYQIDFSKLVNNRGYAEARRMNGGTPSSETYIDHRLTCGQLALPKLNSPIIQSRWRENLESVERLEAEAQKRLRAMMLELQDPDADNSGDGH